MAPNPLSFLDPSKALDELNKYSSPDGLSINQLMNTTLHGGLTYNDFLMLPGKIDFSAHDVITESRITRNVVLKTPFISSPMDTVTGDEMAISMAVRQPCRLSSSDILHVNFSPRVVVGRHRRYTPQSVSCRASRYGPCREAPRKRLYYRSRCPFPGPLRRGCVGCEGPLRILRNSYNW